MTKDSLRALVERIVPDTVIIGPARNTHTLVSAASPEKLTSSL